MIHGTSLALVLLALPAICWAFLPLSTNGKPFSDSRYFGARESRSGLRAIPLELEGQLDATKSWDVTFTYQGETKVIKVTEDTCLLEAAEQEFDAPCSCRNGICTTCSARIEEGQKDQNFKVAVNALSQDQADKGFILSCQTYPTGPDLKVELGMYDVVYEDQYGKHEKKASDDRKKKFSVFG